jgi:photosystem II stability/assembly factor-like uncharacterized protein
MSSRIRILLAFLLAAPTAVVPALATTPAWTLLGPDGGTVDALAIDPVDPRIVYAGTAAGEGVFKSLDSGVTWSRSGTGLPKGFDSGVVALAVNPRRRAVVYAGTALQGLYKSADGGASWLPVRLGTGPATFTVTALAIDPRDPDVVFTGSAYGLFKTADDGVHWKRITAGLPPLAVPRALAIDPRTPGVVYASISALGVYRSRDGGETWKPASRGFPARPEVLTLAAAAGRPAAVYATTNQGVFKSTNGAASWSPAGGGLPFQPPVRSLAIDPRGSSVVYAGLPGRGVFRSRNGGSSWFPDNDGLGNLQVLALAVNPQGTVYAGTAGGDRLTVSGASEGGGPGGVFQASGGQPWRRTVRGLSAVTVTAVAVEAGGDPPILWAGTEALGVFRSPRAGVWRRVPIAGLSGIVKNIVTDPDHPGTVYVLAPPPGGPFNLSPFKTTDAGQTWTPLPVSGPFLGLKRDPLNGALLLFGYGIRRSADGGLTWTGSAGGIEPADLLQDVAFDPSAPQTVYAAGSRPSAARLDPVQPRLYKSADGGSTWTRIDAGLARAAGAIQKVVVSPARPQVLYAASLGTLFRSADAGAHWDQVAEAPMQGIITDLVAGPDGTLYAATDNTGVYASPDGLEWTSIADGLASLVVDDLLLDPADPDRLYAGTAGGGLEVLRLDE